MTHPTPPDPGNTPATVSSSDPPEPVGPGTGTGAAPTAVQPRYLAGPGTHAALVWAPFTGQRWQSQYDEPGNHHTFGDLARLYAGHLPHPNALVNNRTLWHFEARAHPRALPVWLAEMTDGTPPEIIAAFTAALAADAAPGTDQPAYLCRDDGPHPVWPLLHRAGWQQEAHAQWTEATSPDGLVTVTHRPAVPVGRFAPERDRSWTVTVRTAPAHLIAAFLNSLLAPAPLNRPAHLIPTTTWPPPRGARPGHPANPWNSRRSSP